MFFDDAILTPRKKATLRELPPVPDTGWRVPQEFPNLSAATSLAIDCETKETDFENGPGWGRGRGHIVGVSLAAQARDGTRGKWYFPVRHEVEGGDNLDPRGVFGFLREALHTPTIPKAGANLLYDVGWLTTEGVYVDGPLHDVQFAEALIDENALVALDVLGHKYLGRTKTTDALYEWLRAAYPETPKRETRGNIFRAPPRLVGHYAEDDADLPLSIIPHQYEEMLRQGLLDVYRLECDLIPLLIRMRLEGISVDVEQAQRLNDEMQVEIAALYDRIYAEYGYRLNSTDGRQLGPLFKRVGIDTPLTEAGNPSVQKEWLAALEHPLGEIIRDIREREKLCGTFIQSYILDKNVGGKVFPQFHPLKGDDNGAKVGRFASSDPNLQNIPSRTKLGKAVRKCFIPDRGHSHWCKMDYSQIHYRILAHFAVGPGSDDLRASYINNKSMDYHQNVLENVAPLMGWDTTDKEHNAFVRRPIKNVNFGLLYGQSLKSLMLKTAAYFGEGFTEAQAKGFFDAYFEGAPYVKPTMKAIGEEVQQYGYTTSVLGRRCRFNLWEPATWGEWGDPLPYDAAIREYGPFIRRAFEYRGVNYKFQSSEPDIMKTGMVKCLRSGVFDYTGVPRLTVHDELDFSVRDDTPEMREAFAFIQHTMEHAVTLRIPVFVDSETGPNWGQVD
ncbi:DNA polymerase I [Paracoccus phage vB_PmaS-R3]|uniref:DNA polymerase I n=1 Tax=Paracoccus phage vB_PmaS-R3 TaxID=2494563 RepID=A0A0B5A7I1_9CAUD|nr:DNA polymerase [Paracoccus phage vB_PmaS-R3]AJD83126.1 DNA polymerase I [Paracoccus phage vB_PmaS-R3]